ncbi:MAG TPA: hypothetical protein VGM77_06715 [Gemmatimonadales bacterium]|jgi:hypothetical protein
MNKKTHAVNDNGDTEYEPDGQDVQDEVGEDRRDPTTGSLESAEDLRGMAEELTGQADANSEDLTALFANDTAIHVTDGFRGGSDEEGLEESPGDPVKEDEPTTDNI